MTMEAMEMVEARAVMCDLSVLHSNRRKVMLFGCVSVVLLLLQCVGIWLYWSPDISSLRTVVSSLSEGERTGSSDVRPTTSASRLTHQRGAFPWGPIKVQHVDCSKLFAGDPTELARAKTIKLRKVQDTDVTADVNRGCDAFLTDNVFINSSLTAEEKKFPVAYSLLVFKDAAQVRGLLQAIYRPQNFICIHVDKKSKPAFREAMQAMVSCLDNVFLSSRSVNVTWKTFTVLEADLICMKDLLQYKGWRYFINLTGQEFPLKTNLEIVAILTALGGANLVHVSKRRAGRWLKFLPAPHNLTVAMGSVHIAVNRHFVHYTVSSPVAKDLTQWLQPTHIPDETLFATLHCNKQLAILGSHRGKVLLGPKERRLTHMIRFKNWQWFNMPCRGRYVHRICILQEGDLPLLARRQELFANKFHDGYSSLALQCLAEKLYNRTRDQPLGTLPFNVSYYQSVLQLGTV